MLNNEAQAAAGITLLAAASAANTAGATSSWVAIPAGEGDLLVVFVVGALTGSCTPAFEDATDTGGTGAAAVTPNEGAATALVASTVRTYTFRRNSLRTHFRYTGTIVTGPCVHGVAMMCRRKNG